MAPLLRKKKLPAKECRLLQDFIIPSLRDRRFGSRLMWDHKLAKVFCMGWIHKSKRTWTAQDSEVFIAWDIMKGRKIPSTPQDHVDSKQRLRAALRNIKGVKEVSCADGYRKYLIVDLSEEVCISQNQQPRKNVQILTSCTKGKTRECRKSAKSKVSSAAKDKSIAKPVAASNLKISPETEVESYIACEEKDKNGEKTPKNESSEQYLCENLWLPQRILRPRKPMKNTAELEKELDILLGPEKPVKKNTRKGNKKKEQDLDFKSSVMPSSYYLSPEKKDLSFQSSVMENSDDFPPQEIDCLIDSFDNNISAIRDHDYSLKIDDQDPKEICPIFSQEKINLKETKIISEDSENSPYSINKNYSTGEKRTSDGAAIQNEKKITFPVDPNVTRCDASKKKTNKDLTVPVDVSVKRYNIPKEVKKSHPIFLMDKNEGIVGKEEIEMNSSLLKMKESSVAGEKKEQKPVQKRHPQDHKQRQYTRKNTKSCMKSKTVLCESRVAKSGKLEVSNAPTKKQQLCQNNNLNIVKSSDNNSVNFIQDSIGISSRTDIHQRKWYGTKESEISKPEFEKYQKLGKKSNEVKQGDVIKVIRSKNEALVVDEIKKEDKKPYSTSLYKAEDAFCNYEPLMDIDDISIGFSDIDISDTGNQEFLPLDFDTRMYAPINTFSWLDNPRSLQIPEIISIDDKTVDDSKPSYLLNDMDNKEIVKHEQVDAQSYSAYSGFSNIIADAFSSSEIADNLMSDINIFPQEFLVCTSAQAYQQIQGADDQKFDSSIFIKKEKMDGPSTFYDISDLDANIWSDIKVVS